MPETSTPQFKLTVPITGYTIRKDASGVEKYVLSGLASNTNIDLTGERMAKSAIAAMAKSLESNEVTLNNEHGSDWDDDFGQVTKLWSTDGSDLMMEAELDPDHYRTKTLIKALDRGKKLGLSIGGVVKDAGWEFVSELARKVLTYKDIDLFHVAITGTPAVADTWVAPITKSMKDWKEPPMPAIAKRDADVVETPLTPEETPLTDAPTDQRIVATDEVVETPAEDAVVEPSAEESASAEGDQPEAPESDTTTPSDTKEAERPADEVTTDPEPASTPAAPEAPEQKDDAPASAEPAPAPVDEGTSEVTTKSAVFGDYTEIALTTGAIEDLAWTLQSYVWNALIGEATADEKLTAISAGLDDFKTLVLKVATALIDDSNADAVKSAAEAFKANAPETISKSLTEKDAKVAELTKSIEEKVTALEAATKELETIKSRKALAFGTFDTVAKDAKTPDSDGTSVAEAWSQQLFGATK